jgi:hypothetical protein
VTLPQRISRKSDKAASFLSYVEKRNGCWLWDGDIKPTGYGQAAYQGKKVNAHRVSYMLFKGPIPDGMHVMHQCDVRNCVNPDHLSLGTHLDNMRDMVAKGRRRGPARAEMPWRKLSEDDVRKILVSTEPGTVLAAKYGVTKGAIYAIRNGVTWKDIARASA